MANMFCLVCAKCNFLKYRKLIFWTKGKCSKVKHGIVYNYMCIDTKVAVKCVPNIETLICGSPPITIHYIDMKLSVRIYLLQVAVIPILSCLFRTNSKLFHYINSKGPNS